jgi:peptide-methionine (R)-S-oxide reductase
MKKLIIICALLISGLHYACSQHPPENTTTSTLQPNDSGKVVKTETEWKKTLTADQCHVLREKGTERPFTGALYNNKEKGSYVCAGCGNVLFSSKHKFDSGTGWPSYWQAVSKNAITSIPDTSYGMARTEIVCAKCDGHLGHLFEDGPQPTGLRFCVNSASLKFIKEK